MDYIIKILFLINNIININIIFILILKWNNRNHSENQD